MFDDTYRAIRPGQTRWPGDHFFKFIQRAVFQCFVSGLSHRIRPDKHYLHRFTLTEGHDEPPPTQVINRAGRPITFKFLQLALGQIMTAVIKTAGCITTTHLSNPASLYVDDDVLSHASSRIQFWVG